ncbi:MAG: hypothetical protein FJ139_06575 [Deltaproteobacteria bacterium]|nr:hypothetical protein [Deltaproteobacteria bacterium]
MSASFTEVLFCGILIAGLACFVLLPFRIVLLVRLFHRWKAISIADRILIIVSIFPLIASTMLWLAVAYSAAMLILNIGIKSTWGMSEVGMSMTVFLIFYLLFEILIFLPRRRKHE